MTEVMVLYTHKKSGLFAALLLLALLVASIPAALADPGFTLEDVTTWHWVDDTEIRSVAYGDVDGDPAVEIVTGGKYWDGTRLVAQLCVWDGSTLALEDVKTWYWVGHTYVDSVACGDVDGDGAVEIVTGGYHHDGTRFVAQLCVWNGGTLALEDVTTWYWTADTEIFSVAVGDVDGDQAVEIVTGGAWNDGTLRWSAQLCVWDGSTLALEGVKTWQWGDSAGIRSVVCADVDGDAQVEIVTGGWYYDGTRYRAQLCVWNGATLALEDVTAWYWVQNTFIWSVAVANVDGDPSVEIVTGGSFYDGTREVAQLCVWTGSTLTLEDVTTWHWVDDTEIRSVACGDVDGDPAVEIVTGGYTSGNAQLAVWDGATLTLEGVRTWYWVGWTYIESVACADVDGDGSAEIVTGGWYYDDTRDRAQLCVWGFT